MTQATNALGETATPARAWRRRGALGLGVALVGILVWSILSLSGADGGISAFAAAAVSGVTASLASRPLTPASAPSIEPVAPIETETLKRLRHDLRGILSPALMTADRLLMTTQDPVAKRAAETMVETIERAEKRLAG